MKKYTATLVFMVAFAVAALVQAQEVSISDLQTPVSPGFVLADQTPSSVSRPTNPKAFVGSLLSLKNGGAVEFTPYWLVRSRSRDELSYEKYVKMLSPMVQTLGISAATFKSDSGSYLSTGIRLTPFRIYNRKTNARMDRIRELLSKPPGQLDLAAIAAERDSLLEMDRRPVFVVELAGAWLGYSNTSSFGGLKSSRLGVWANAAWKPSPLFNVVGLVRYHKSKAAEQPPGSDNLDLGGSLGLENKAETFSLSAEFVYRNNYTLKDQYHRLALVANYKVMDKIYLVGSFGKNFTKTDNIIALLGINIGISKDQMKLND